MDMAPNLISHHLRVLREAGLVDVERDPEDARWVYYSLNREALEELKRTFGLFFDPLRIKPRRQTCGSQAAIVSLDSILAPVCTRHSAGQRRDILVAGCRRLPPRAYPILRSQGETTASPRGIAKCQQTIYTSCHIVQSSAVASEE
jgi:hypothetical protein